VQADLFRGVHHYEADGTPLKRDNHPDWITWSMGTHWHTGVSRDRLGKTGPQPSQSGTGWLGYDDQHRSQNNLAAYLALTDDPLMLNHVYHQTTVDEAAHRVRYQGTGAARAQGRTNGTLAQLATVVPDDLRARIVQVVTRRMEPIINNPMLDVSGPMKVLSWMGPDARKPIYDENGNLAPTTSMWEHGLAAVGLYKVAKENLSSGLPGGHPGSVLRTVCETLLNFGFFFDGNNWHTVHDIWYRDGEAPPGGLFEASPHLTTGHGGVGTWTFAGILVAREVLGGGHTDLDNYIAWRTDNREASDRRTAEWWAAVETVRF
jgi:hypothetical protein